MNKSYAAKLASVGIISNEVVDNTQAVGTREHSWTNELSLSVTVHCGSGVIAAHRRCPAVCRVAVFSDLRRPPQIYPRGKRHGFELYGPLADEYLSRKL
jgi:hypothetical protein